MPADRIDGLRAGGGRHPLLRGRRTSVRAYGHLGSQFGHSTLAAYVLEYGSPMAVKCNRGADRTINQAMVPVLNALVDVLFEHLGARGSDQEDDLSGMLDQLEETPDDVHQ